MKLLIATPLYPPDIGGPATYAKILEQYFPQENIAVQIAYFGAVRKYPKGIRHIVYFFMVRRAAKKADVVFALDPVSTGFPAFLAAKSLHKPFVVKIVGDYAWEQGRQRFGITQTLDDFVKTKEVPFSVSLLRSVQKYVARSATGIIVPSRYLKGVVEAWGISNDVITVIYNAVDTEKDGIVPEQVLALGHPLILSVGRIVPWKGMEMLVGLVEQVRATHPTASLAIVGSGPGEESLHTVAKEKLKFGYALTGALSHEDTIAVMKHADFFALNTSYEGFSHVLVEALRSGTPVITTPVGGNTELLTNGENSLLCSVDDEPAWYSSILSILNDNELRERIKRGAEETSATFSLSRMVSETAVYFQKFI